jgi:hypothetical protein
MGEGTLVTPLPPPFPPPPPAGEVDGVLLLQATSAAAVVSSGARARARPSTPRPLRRPPLPSSSSSRLPACIMTPRGRSERPLCVRRGGGGLTGTRRVWGAGGGGGGRCAARTRSRCAPDSKRAGVAWRRGEQLDQLWRARQVADGWICAHAARQAAGTYAQRAARALGCLVPAAVRTADRIRVSHQLAIPPPPPAPLRLT